MWRATILCSVGPFYKHRPINLDTPQTSIAHARTYTRDIVCGVLHRFRFIFGAADGV